MSIDAKNKDPVKVGVIGCGRIGIVHLGAINKAPGVQPIVVSNPTVSKAEDGKSIYDLLIIRYHNYMYTSSHLAVFRTYDDIILSA